MALMSCRMTRRRPSCVVALLVYLSLVACSGADSENAGSCRTKEVNSRADFDGQNGEYAVLLSTVDVRTRTISFDVIQYLVGDDAVREHRRIDPTGPGGPPTDYAIVNASARFDRATVSSEPRVRVLSPELVLVTSTFQRLPPERTSGRQPWLGLYWLTFQGGVVTEICEQYTA
jgi:hypothetical protein